MGARSSRNTTQNNRSDGHLLEYFRNTFIRGGGAALPLLFSATGGVKSGPTGGYFFHYFNGSGSSPFTCNKPIPGARFVLVAGGGGGAGGYGGGAGGGGVVYSNGTYEITSGSWTVVTGAGGAGGGPGFFAGSQGGDSTFSNGVTTITAKGGGFGRVNIGGGQPGGSGGGGGDRSGPFPSGAATQPSQNPGIGGIVNSGFSGGMAPANPPGWAYGGGGGAGEVGASPGTPAQGGRGGAGLGPPTWTWLPTAFLNNGYAAGGGGGSGYSSGNTPGAGSPDGTGGAAGLMPNGNGSPGIYGGGGGAGTTPSPGQPYSSSGGGGGDGAMIIAYPDSL